MARETKSERFTKVYDRIEIAGRWRSGGTMTIRNLTVGRLRIFLLLVMVG